MAPLTRSDTTALEHILAVLLEQSATVTGSPIHSFRACFVPPALPLLPTLCLYSRLWGVEFTTKADGSDAGSKLNVIQIKKLRSLIDWFPKSLHLRLPAGLIDRRGLPCLQAFNRTIIRVLDLLWKRTTWTTNRSNTSSLLDRWRWFVLLHAHIIMRGYHIFYIGFSYAHIVESIRIFYIIGFSFFHLFYLGQDRTNS
jgi:hypothetical protein